MSGAGQAVDEARQTAERALFVGNRMPILLGWQVENLPELGATATKLERLMASMEGILGKDFSFESLIDRIFWRTAVLVIIFFAAMLAAGVLYKIAVQRWASGSPRS